MDMVRHDAPREQPVAFLIKVTQSVRQFFSDHWIPEVASAVIVVKKLLDNRRRKLLYFPSLVGAQGPVKLVGSVYDCLAFGFNALQD